MVKWYHSLYVGEGARKDLKSIRKKLNHGHAGFSQYIITLALNGTDMLDIMSGLYLPEKKIRNGLPMIVGIASTREEAFLLVRKMIDDCLAEQGNPDLRLFFT